jgi:hypothetical protein
LLDFFPTKDGSSGLKGIKKILKSQSHDSDFLRTRALRNCPERKNITI